MFDKEKEGKFKSERNESIKRLIKEVEEGCTKTEDVKETIRASFQFIKDNPLTVEGRTVNAHITLGTFLTKSIDSVKNEFSYGITDVDGVVKEVCESYVVLSSTNVKGQKFQVKVLYDEIVYFWHSTIYENFEAYLNYINCVVSPLYKDLCSESYNLIVRIFNIISKNYKNERDFVFILNKVLTRRIKAEDVLILRNLVITEELFILPITSIQGISQVPNQ